MTYLSVVIPCFNEEDALGELLRRVDAATSDWAHSREVILVDDGSTDGTWEGLKQAAETYPGFRALRLSANFGHQMALSAGLQAARGERILMLDADLQDPPELLSDMMPLMDQGYDVVYGRRAERQGETGFKKASAYLFYRVLNALSDVEIPSDVGDFRLVSRKALDAVLAMPERSRFLRGMFSWVGFRQIGLEYRREKRVAGETSYSMKKMLNFGVDAITSFSTRPLRWATRLAFASIAFTGVLLIYVAHSLIFYATAPGWASVLLAISFFSAIQLLVLGILGEYLGRLFVEMKQRPLYFCEEELGQSSDAKDQKDPIKVVAS